MLKRLIQWLKKFFQNLFGKKQTPAKARMDVQKQPPPPLTDTDLEFLFTELLEGVHQARGQQWALKWLHNIENRVSTKRWVEWLRQFGSKLVASAAPNNELATRMIQLGELEVGEVGDVAYDIGMQLLTRNQPEPIWEYSEAGQSSQNSTEFPESNQESSTVFNHENLDGKESVETLPEGEFETITLDQLFTLLQQDENVRQMVSQQLGIQSDDATEIIEALVNQFQGNNQSTTEQ